MDLDDLRGAIRALGHDPDVLLAAYRKASGRDDAQGFALFLVHTCNIRSDVLTRLASQAPTAKDMDAEQIKWSMLPTSAAAPAPRAPAPSAAPTDLPAWDAAARAAALGPMSGFATLDPTALAALGAATRAVAVPAGEALFQVGDRAAGLSVVVAGRLTIAAAGAATPKPIGPGVTIGAQAFQDAGVRTADVRALEDAVVLVLDDAGRRAVIAERPSAASWFAALARTRFPGVDAVLRDVFGAIDQTLVDRLCAGMDPVYVSGGAALFTKGDAADAMYVLLHGSLEAQLPGGGESRIFRGQPVGERALLTQQPRSATVIALRDSELLRLAAADFQAVLAEQAGAMLPFIRMLAGRMFAAAPRDAERGCTTVALVPLHPGLPVAELAAHVARDRGGAVIDAAAFDGVHGKNASTTPPSHPNARAFTAWMSDLEDRQPLVVYVGDGVDSEWTRRCVRGADRVLLIADASASPAPGAVDAAVEGLRHTAVELVLLHAPDADLPRGTAAWLAARPFVGRHHHARRGHTPDLDRLVRHLTGRTIGFVLGGGGAKGFAHLGLLRAFSEAGIPIDAVAGTSMGAGMGAGLAMGLPFDEIARGIRRVFLDTRFNRSFTFPFVSLLSAVGIEPVLEDLGQGRDIEDTWVPFLAVAMNLTRAEIAILDAGPIHFAVRASGSLPGILPPAVRDGELFVDGGLLDNLPVGPMRARMSGRVVAIDVGTQDDIRVDPAMTRLPTGFQVLMNRLNPFAPRVEVPAIAKVMYQSLVCTSRKQQEWSMREADVALRPPVDRFDLMAFERSAEAVEVGYRYGLENVADVLARLRPSLGR